MKKIILNLTVFSAILLFVTVSCEKNKSNPDKTATVQRILEIEARMNALNSGTGKMTNFMSVIGASQYKDGDLNIAISGSDSGYTSPDSLGYWEPFTCATVTETDNEDGTHTIVYDYGEGCEEYGNMIRGKITYIWKNVDNSYFSEVIYDHYYSFGMEMNGRSVYSFTSDGTSYANVVGDSTVSIMPIEFYWSGSSTGEDDITIVFDDGNTVIYTSVFSYIWDNNSYKVMEADYHYSSTIDGYEYRYQVTEPLISDYTCLDTWVPVSGIEIITVIQNDVTEEYSLDYGSGNCDNLATLTENGKSSVIDFGDIFTNIWYEGDSSTVSVRPKK